jgi:hypothetical protein
MVRRFQSTQEREAEGRKKGYTGVLESDILRSEAKLAALEKPDPNSSLVYRKAADGAIVGVEQDVEDRASGKEDGWEKWKEVLRLRFVRGDDGDFDYASVDNDEQYDDRGEEDRRAMERYLEDEEVEVVRQPQCETGVQDF